MPAKPQAFTKSEQAIAAGAASIGLIKADVQDVPLLQRVVRAEFLRSLLLGLVVDGKDQTPITVASSLQISKAWILGEVDLSECGASGRLPHLTFTDCLFTNGIQLQTAVLGGFRVNRGFILQSGLRANSASFSAAVEINETRFEPGGELNFARSQIENNCTISDVVAGACEPGLKTLRSLSNSALMRLQQEVTGSTELSPEAGSRLSDELAKSDPLFCCQTLDDVLDHAERGITRSPDVAKMQGVSRISFKSAHVSGDVHLKGTPVGVRLDNAAVQPGPAPKKAEAEKDCDPDTSVDAQYADIKGNFLVERSANSLAVLNGRLMLCNAKIGAEFAIRGTVIRGQTKRGDALDVEGAIIDGSCFIENVGDTRSEIHGGLRLLGTTIGGQLLLRGVWIEHREEWEHAITADGVNVKSDLFIRPSRDDKFFPEITGTVRLPGAEVGGQFAIRGAKITKSAVGEHAVAARDAHIKGGVFVRSHGAIGTVITGDVHLQYVTIDGVFNVTGTVIHPGSAGIAINTDGAHIKGDILVAHRDPDDNSARPGHEGCSIEGTIRMAGATVGGRLRMLGASISAPKNDAILASGADIAGGVFLDPIQSRLSGDWIYCNVTGTLRFNHAHIGSNFQLRGVTLSSTDSGVALLGIGAEFGQDLYLRADENGHTCQIVGEIRLWGATIRGELKILGGKLTASSTGFALDGYNSEIAMGVFLGPVEKSSDEKGCLCVKGILGFAYAEVGSLMIGDPDPSVPVAAVKIEGQLRLSGIHVVDDTSIERTLLTPPRTLQGTLRDDVDKKLRGWHVSDRSRMILGAENANLGSKLYIDLHPETCGAIDLYSAKVGTLSDNGTASWGEKPVGPGWADDKSQSAGDMKGVKLGLNGFAYAHLHELEKLLPQSEGWWKRLKNARNRLSAPGPNIGVRARVKDTWHELRSHGPWRLEWLSRQFPDGRVTEATFVPLPYIQLASVFRAHGYLKEANQVSVRRRDYQTRYGTDNAVDRMLQRGYGRCFGYSYLSSRALLTLAVLFFFNWWFVYAGTHNTLGWSLGLAGDHQIDDQRDWLRQAADPHAPPDSDPGVCRTPWTYVLNQSFPVLHLTSEKDCAMAADTCDWYRAWHNTMLILGWIALPTSLLTFSGILREETK